MSTIKTTQNSFLFRYGASLMIFTELFMICTITVLLYTNDYIPTFIMLFISPLLGSMIAGKISKKCKSVVFKETFNINFIIINIIIHILIYFFNFQFNIIMVIIYGIGVLIGFFYANKTIKKFKENMKIEESDTEIITKGEKIPIKEFKLGKINGESIREFLKTNHLKEENYLLAEMSLTAKEYIIKDMYSVSRTIPYIVYFDDEKLYFFELSKFGRKIIKNGFFVKFNDLKIKKVKKGLIRYKIKLEFKDGSVNNIQIIKQVPRLFLQKEYSKKLYDKLSELKNKE